MGLHQPGSLHGAFRVFRPDEQAIVLPLCQLRYDLPAGILAPGTGRCATAWRRSQTGGDAVRTLHAGRGAVQICGRVSDLFIPEAESVAADERGLTPIRQIQALLFEKRAVVAVVLAHEF